MPKTHVLSNAKLNALDPWKDRRCTRCGRRYPNTVLNIEGTIHHREALHCVDRQSCEKFRKKVRS